MEEQTTQDQPKSSITLTRSATNGKYGWAIKGYTCDPLMPHDVENAVDIDLLLRAEYYPDEVPLEEQLRKAIAAHVAEASTLGERMAATAATVTS